MNRREFTKKLTLAGSSISLQLNLLQSLAANETTPGSSYKAVVCLLLAGGIDSYRMMLPYGTEEYEQYKILRGIAASGLDVANGFTRIGTTDCAINNQFKGVWGNGTHGPDGQDNVAFIANVGSLTQPIRNVADFLQVQKLPFALGSHNDQIKQVQTLDHSGHSGTGWMNRLMDSFLESPLNHNKTANTLPSANITFSGSNYAQTSQNRNPLAIGFGGPAQLQPVSTLSTAREVSHKNALFIGANSIMGCANYKRNVLQKLYAENSKLAFENSQAFATYFEEATALSYGSPHIQPLIRAMKAGIKQGIERQTFFIVLGNWDHHSDLLSAYNKNVSENLNPFLRDFNEGMRAAGLWDKTTLFTTSDFGRNLVPNSSGTDHAWGGNHIVMGGAVKKGVYGKYPKMILRDKGDITDINMRTIDTTGGVMLPSFGWDEYLEPIVRWFIPNISVPALNTVLPNLSNFSGRPPMNFM
jgi:uncharacterized protein (DUF1501 family)